MKNIFMTTKKPKSRRKRYATEFLIRSDNENLVSDLKKVADKKRLSVNALILNQLDKVVANGKV